MQAQTPLRRSLILTLLAAVALAPLWSQSALSPPELRIGDRYERQAYALDRIGSLSPGPDQTWDFSQLARRPESDLVVSIIAPTGTAGAASFPEATLCERLTDPTRTRDRYWFQTAETLRLLGLAEQSTDQPLRIVPQGVTLYDRPLSLGLTHADSFTASVKHEGLTLERSGNLELVADASGTLILPNARFTSVLRVILTQRITQAALLPGQPRHIQTTSVLYYATSCAYPVFSLSEQIDYGQDSAARTSIAYVTFCARSGTRARQAVPDRRPDPRAQP